MELPRLNGGKVANEGQPMSALMWVGPSWRWGGWRAATPGGAGQRVQKLGGGAGISPSAVSPPVLCATMSLAQVAAASASTPAGRTSRRNAATPLTST